MTLDSLRDTVVTGTWIGAAGGSFEGSVVWGFAHLPNNIPVTTRVNTGIIHFLLVCLRMVVSPFLIQGFLTQQIDETNYVEN
jgi:uncharacterized protein with PQ loop repeat